MNKKEIIKGILAFILLFGFMCLFVGSCNRPLIDSDYLITFTNGKTKIIKNCVGYNVSKNSIFYYRNDKKETYKNIKSVTLHLSKK